MFSFFNARLPIDDDEFEWLLACFKWFLEEFGGLDRFRGTSLIHPTESFFPASEMSGHDRAMELFLQVKAYVGMVDWQCDLKAGATERESRVSAGLALRQLGRSPPLGTFGYENGRYWISYNPAELARPPNLVATFAHELAHYLMHTATTVPPGGRELEEHATDLAAVYLGFGIFMANSAKTFRQFQNFEEMGWEMRPQGYLSELALVTGLAIFVRLIDIDSKVVAQSLKDYLRKPFRSALAAVERRYPDLGSAIASVDLSDWR